MRINPISISHARNYQNLRHNETIQNPIPQSETVAQSPAFKGWGGVCGTILGTAVGIGLTALTGGAADWTIPLLGGSAAIGGDMYEKKDKPSTDQFGR